MDKALQARVNAILTLARQQDWRDPAFTLLKAHVCAELSAIVYEDVQDYEIKNASRVHLFTSAAYQRIVKAKVPNSIIQILGEGDFRERFFVVRGRYAVVLGAIVDDAVILAVRGTVFRQLWDWKANVDARKYHVSPTLVRSPFSHESIGLEDTHFHRGFFESIIPQFGSISDEIKRRVGKDKSTTIVWTGHSLGGAMAAIGNAMSESWLTREWLRERLPGSVRGAYTFGMPRYGGLGAVCCFVGPHHIYRPKDLVPSVPLRAMGFADCSREYAISDSGEVGLTERTDPLDLAGHLPKLLSSLQAHSIDGYADALALAVGRSRP